VREGVTPPAVGVPRYHSWKISENSHAKSCILVTTTLISGLPRTCISEQTTACQGVNQFQNFNFSAVVAPLVVTTKKKQSNGNYETILAVKFRAF